MGNFRAGVKVQGREDLDSNWMVGKNEGYFDTTAPYTNCRPSCISRWCWNGSGGGLCPCQQVTGYVKPHCALAAWGFFFLVTPHSAASYWKFAEASLPGSLKVNIAWTFFVHKLVMSTQNEIQSVWCLTCTLVKTRRRCYVRTFPLMNEDLKFHFSLLTTPLHPLMHAFNQQSNHRDPIDVHWVLVTVWGPQSCEARPLLAGAHSLVEDNI